MSKVFSIAQQEHVSMVWTKAMELTPHGRLAPFVKWVWAKLKKYGYIKDYWEPKSTFQHYRVDPQGFVNKLLMAQEVVQDFNHREPDTLIIGSKTYTELVGALDYTMRFSFNAEYVKQDQFGRRIMGLKVVVVPWMEGMVALRRDML